MARRLERIGDLAERAARANWCVRTLASHCRVSLSTLERHIKEKFGMSPQRWLAQLRMDRAAKKLREGLMVKEAAFETGFKNPHHFSHRFKEHEGHPPSRHAVQR